MGGRKWNWSDLFLPLHAALALSLSVSGASGASRHGHQIPNSILRFSSSINTRERRGLSRLYPVTPLQFVYLSITSRPVTHLFLFSLFFFFFSFFNNDNFFFFMKRISLTIILGSQSLAPVVFVYHF